MEQHSMGTRTASRPKIRTFDAAIVGTNAGDRRQYLLSVATGNAVRIVPEPTNPFDANAVRVDLATQGAYIHVGYLPAPLAARMAGRLPAEGVDATVADVRYNPNDGLPAGFDVRLPMALI
jgi:hypothetical protein